MVLRPFDVHMYVRLDEAETQEEGSRTLSTTMAGRMGNDEGEASETLSTMKHDAAGPWPSPSLARVTLSL